METEKKKDFCDMLNLDDLAVGFVRSALIERCIRQCETCMRYVRKAVSATFVTRWYWTMKSKKANDTLSRYIAALKDFDCIFYDDGKEE